MAARRFEIGDKIYIRSGYPGVVRGYNNNGLVTVEVNYGQGNIKIEYHDEQKLRRDP